MQQELERQRLSLQPSIQLDAYFQLPATHWEEERVFIHKINDYLRDNSFPLEYAPAPERSFALVGDEKWISEKGGQKLLERIGLWDKLCIVPVAFAINLGYMRYSVKFGRNLFL